MNGTARTVRPTWKENGSTRSRPTLWATKDEPQIIVQRDRLILPFTRFDILITPLHK